MSGRRPGLDTLDGLAEEIARTDEHINECKAYQLELRQRLETLFSDTAEDFEGIETLHGDRFSIRLTHKLNRRIDLEAADAIARKFGLAKEDAFNLKATFSARKWARLPDDARKALSNCVTAKKALAGIEIRKNKKNKE